MKKLVFVVVLVLMAGNVVMGQEDVAPAPQNFALPSDAILIWRSQPNAPQFPELSHIPEGLMIPNNYRAIEIGPGGIELDAIEIGPGGIKFDFVCWHDGDRYSPGARNDQGQTCTCNVIAYCQWVENVD